MHSDTQMVARLFLGLACCWPLVLMALFAASAPHIVGPNTDHHGTSSSSLLRNELRNVLDRVDIMGYGPTHPRTCIVLTAEAYRNAVSYHDLEATVESILNTTDPVRIFAITIVVDGMEAKDHKLIQRLQNIEQKKLEELSKHKKHLLPRSKDKTTQPPMSKIQVVFNAQARGVTASRNDGAYFCQMQIGRAHV